MPEKAEMAQRLIRDDVQFISSLLNIERRNLVPDCYADCAKALRALSLRIEMLSFVDNFIFAQDGNADLPADEFLAALIELVTDRFKFTLKGLLVEVGGHLSHRKGRGIALILNEVLIGWMRGRSSDDASEAIFEFARAQGEIMLKIELSPLIDEESEVSSLVLTELLREHAGHMEPDSLVGENGWRIALPDPHHLKFSRAP
ncbi:hypothetical protein [Erythrobacter rubeus]|uniref:Uncharacterized protein n=1 Tax=Erythrobacter rubeus TaxID=2760803 RepID=A0ABR8KY72_9SPHN|nr:hypothetical protein [Erythrobacter rubeus]MBD2843177.1 hypothetical protein [Erythrobacter rubeus]